ncbi:MAG: NADH-quinone oxidoreductase subunit NuoF [Bradymonadaceae bacterium]
METPLTDKIDRERGPLWLEGYEEAGGYRAVEKALGEMTPSEVTQEVDDSTLQGRGGAGFPTGQKWSFVPMGEEAPEPKYIVCNADEMEPGTFKDRFLMEGDPHGMVESMIVAGYAIEADVGYIFLRWAYKKAETRLRWALEEAREAGYLGEDILGSGWDFECHLHVSAGRYMCGEETALLNVLEGGRATPRAKPPYPQTSGLWGQPTVVQNVETLYCVPHIVERGADWFVDLSRTEDGGTKLYGVSGQVEEPGLWELPMGTTLREVLEEHADGMKDGYGFRGALPGGASTDFLVDEHMDVPLDFSHVQEHGSRLGTGTIIVLDDQTCPVDASRNLQKFFARESCGWCTPCREGLPWLEELLAALCAGEGEPGDLEKLDHHTHFLGPGNTFCALAPGAMEPLQSALEYFREDFERHITEGECPYGADRKSRAIGGR